MAQANEVYFNQMSQEFQQAGFRTQSLCGPVSFINWLQYQRLQNEQPPLDIRQAVAVLNLLRSKLDHPLDEGLNYQQIQSFLENSLRVVGLDHKYLAVQVDENPENILSKTPALLLIGTYQVTHRRSMPAPDETFYQSYHYVLKVAASNSSISFIDPEDPVDISEMQIKKNSNASSLHQWILTPLPGKPVLPKQTPGGMQTYSTVIKIVELRTK